MSEERGDLLVNSIRTNGHDTAATRKDSYTQPLRSQDLKFNTFLAFSTTFNPSTFPIYICYRVNAMPRFEVRSPAHCAREKLALPIWSPPFERHGIRSDSDSELELHDSGGVLRLSERVAD